MMKLQIISLVIFTFLISVYGKLPEENLSTPELIRYWKYPAETHKVLTKDGYYLTLHRIPYGRKQYEKHRTTSKNRPVFFLQHGLLCSDSNWVTNLPEQSLGFMLADAGYDVWLGNVRGNTYSRKHKKYFVQSEKFWKFSFQEMAEYDLPSMIDYALNATGQQQLYYVGHSQGTMIAFAGLSENKELNKKIKHFFALAPVSHLGNSESPVTYLSYLESPIGSFFKLIGVREFLPSSYWVKYLADTFCGFDSGVCGNFLFLIAGSDEKNMNSTRLPVYLTHTPAGTSVRNMLHFAQLVQSNKFQKYDEGWYNMIKYGSMSPPQYDLTQIKSDISLFWGTQDTLADPEDVKYLAKTLKTVKNNVKVAGYNHLDFIWGMSAREKVYKQIIRMVRNIHSPKVRHNKTAKTNMNK